MASVKCSPRTRGLKPSPSGGGFRVSGYISLMDPDPDRVWLAELLETVGPEGAYEIAELLGIDLDEE